MKLSLILSFATLLALPVVHSQDLSELQTEAKAKLDDALARLAEVRTAVREEKLPLATERQELLATLETVRREADRMTRLRDNSRTDITELENRVKTRQEELDYISNLTAEYARSLESRIDVAEQGSLGPILGGALDAAQNDTLSAEAKMKAQLDVLGLSLKRAEELVGGKLLPGRGLSPDGRLVEGAYALFGPATYFASTDGTLAGLSMRDGTGAIVMPVADGAYDEALGQIVRGEAALLPVDAQLGTAIAIAQVKDPLMVHIRKGGIWMIPIIFCGLVAVFISAFKFFELITLPKVNEGAVYDILSRLADGKKDEALAAANSVSGPTGMMLQRATRHAEQDTDLIEEVMYESIVETQPKVLRLLPLVSVCAAVSPLLGLLGTVTGMINTFTMLQIFGTGDAKSLSGGISEALITTEYGLIVAIPSLVLYGILNRMAKGYLGKMEKVSISYVNGIKELRQNATVAV